MARVYARITRRPRRVLAWGALMAMTLGLATLLQAVAASVLVEPAQVAPPIGRLSAATAALSDGDDVRARFLASFKGEHTP